VNLIILVGATYHVKLSGGNQLGIGYTSVIICSFFNVRWDPCLQYLPILRCSPCSLPSLVL